MPLIELQATIFENVIINPSMEHKVLINSLNIISGIQEHSESLTTLMTLQTSKLNWIEVKLSRLEGKRQFELPFVLIFQG